MKMIEVIISAALFLMVVSVLTTLFSSVQSYLEWSSLRRDALHLAHDVLEGFSATTTPFVKDGFEVNIKREGIDNFTMKVVVVVSYDYHGRRQEAKLSLFVTDMSESKGQNSCRPTQDHNHWLHPKISSFDLSTLDASIRPTDIDVVGKYAYISSNDSRASSSDIFILDISNNENVRLISKLDTGPGLAALAVAGERAYVGNTSINAQMQIIDISDPSLPSLISSYKLPGTYADGTTIANAIFYKANRVYLGTQKSQIGELHHVDVSDPYHPFELDSVEIGHAINDIFAAKDVVYVASPHGDEMKAFKVSSSGILSPYYSYNHPGSTGNGKRFSLFLDTLYVGKTQTFAREEVLMLSATSSELKGGIQLGSSVQGLLRYGSLLFILLHRAAAGFIVQEVGSFDVPTIPLDMDCDGDLFVIISEDSSVITFITPS